jgi:hypothetical protein
MRKETKEREQSRTEQKRRREGGREEEGGRKRSLRNRSTETARIFQMKDCGKHVFAVTVIQTASGQVSERGGEIKDEKKKNRKKNGK